MTEITEELLDNLPKLKKYVENKLLSAVVIAGLPDSLTWFTCVILAGKWSVKLEEIMSEIKERDLDIPQELIEKALISVRKTIEPRKIPQGILNLS